MASVNIWVTGMKGTPEFFVVFLQLFPKSEIRQSES